jgi:hypothetical protein
MILPFVSASELRSEVGRHKHRIEKHEVGSMTIVGTFPANPVYASLSFYEDGCGTPLTQVKTVVTGVCFTNGGTSTKYTCSKPMFSSFSYDNQDYILIVFLIFHFRFICYD